MQHFSHSGYQILPTESVKVLRASASDFLQLSPLNRSTKSQTEIPHCSIPRRTRTGTLNTPIPGYLASELISSDDHSGSSDITPFDGIDSDQVERTTFVEDAAVTALLDELSSTEQQFGYDLVRKLHAIAQISEAMSVRHS